MPIKKDVSSGWHFISYLVPRRDNKRRRYVPQPLRPAQDGVIGFFVDLFRGGPNPFLASPLAVSIDRRTKFEKRARVAGRTHSEGAAGRLAKAVHAELDRCLRKSNQRADDVLDALDLETNEEEAKLEECRPNVIKEALKGELEEVVSDVDNHLGPAAKNLVSRSAELDKFIADHDLNRKKSFHWGKAISAKSIGIIILITLGEFVLNTAFFAGSQKSGMIGGAALAMLLSIATIFLGVFFGLAYQFSDSRAEGGGWRGRIGFVLLIGATVFYLLLLTLARRAGEAGDLDMFGTAAREIEEHPFSGMLDLPALVYCFFTIGIIAFVAWKFVDTMGHFPRIRNYKLALEAAEHEHNETRISMAEALEQRIDDAMQKLDDVPSLVQARALALKEILVDYENVVYQFNSDVEEINDAGDILLGVAREHVGGAESDFAAAIDSDSHVTHFADRLTEFRKRIDLLLKRTEVSQTAIERCRAEMGNLGKRKRKELELRCDRLIPSGQISSPFPNEPSQGAGPDGKVTWLRRPAIG